MNNPILAFRHDGGPANVKAGDKVSLRFEPLFKEFPLLFGETIGLRVWILFRADGSKDGTRVLDSTYTFYAFPWDGSAIDDYQTKSTDKGRHTIVAVAWKQGSDATVPPEVAYHTVLFRAT
jgi:hypothetical protein